MSAELRGRKWIQQVRRDWTEAARSWERWEPNVLHSLAAVDPHLVRALALAPRHRVLDLGCGSGEPTLTIAPLVAPGIVTGLDISPAMLAIARRRARLRAVRNVTFQRGDIAHGRFRGRFDRVVARYGIMFVDDLALALRHVLHALTPGGRAAFAVWGPIEKNPFFLVRAQAALPFLSEPPPDPEHWPSPLRLWRPGRLARLMREAGFRGVKSEGVQAPLVYLDEQQYIDFNLGVPGPLMNLYDSLTPPRRRRLQNRLLRGIRPYRNGGLLRIPGFAWIVAGHRP